MTSRPAPSWAGDVHDGVEAWTRSAGAAPSTRPARGSRGAGRTRSRESRSAPPLPASVPESVRDDPEPDHESVGRKILLDALTGQARSRKELADKLAKKDVPADLASALLDRFEEVGLVDDEAFARAWIAARQPSKGLARRALAQELRRKGVDDDVAREALDEIDPDDEESAARALVRKKLRTMRGLERAGRRVGSWGCSPARATRPAWRSRWSGTSSGPTTPSSRRPDRRLLGHTAAMASKKKNKDTQVAGATGEAVRPLLRLPEGPVDLAGLDPRATPGFDGDKAAGKAALPGWGSPWRTSRSGSTRRASPTVDRRVLLVLQGMDTSGKGGVLRHTVGLIDPQGVRISSFKAPTDEERRHDFLWRIRSAAARGRHGGCLRPLPLRGRPHRAGARAEPRGRDRAPLRRHQPLRGPAGRQRGHDPQVHAAHLRQGAEGAAPGPARRPDQALEVQPRRHRRALAVARLPQAYEIALERSNTPEAPVVRRAQRQQVVPQPGRWPAAARGPARDRSGVAGGRLRRVGRASTPHRGGPLT